MAGRTGGAEKADRDALEALGVRIDRARTRLAGPPRKPRNKYSTLSIAWRMILELVVGLMVGAAIGYGLDTVAGTRPVLLLLFAGLGLAAGIKTMVATSRELALGTDGDGLGK